MAKKIRFPLDMGNGVEVRTLEELQDNFSVEKVLGYYVDGKLVTWLKDRYLDDIANAIENLNPESSEITKQICDVFGVEYNKEMDMEALRERNRKLDLLKEFSDKKEFVDVVDDIAFDQDDLYDLLDEGKSKIYLCGERFSIPLSKTNMQYIGINKPTVIINSTEEIDFTSKMIEFNDCVFDEKYQMLLNSSNNAASESVVYSGLIDDFNSLKGSNLVKRIENEISNETALADKARYMLYQIKKYVPRERKNITLDSQEEIKKAASNGYVAAQIRCIFDFDMYDDEYANKDEYKMHFCQDDYLEQIDMEDCFILYEVGIALLSVDEHKAIEYIKKSANMGCWLGEHSLGLRYDYGQGVEQNYSVANEWYNKSAQKGVTGDYYNMAWNCLYNMFGENEKAQEYIMKLAEDKDYLQSITQNYEKQIKTIKYYYECNYEFYSKLCTERYNCDSEARPRSEVIQQIHKIFLNYFELVRAQFNPNCNQEFKKYVSQYKNKYESLLKEKVILMYGYKQISSISENYKEYAPDYENDIYNILAQLLENYQLIFSLSDVNESDYDLSESTFGRGLLSPRVYYGNCDFTRFNDLFDNRLKEYNQATAQEMQKYFYESLSLN